MPSITSITVEEMEVGQKASYSKTCSWEDVQLFAKVSGDVNPVHLDEDFAAGTQFKQRIAHGMCTSALVSAGVAIVFPGPGSIYLGQDISFKAPVFIDDTIDVELEVESIRKDKSIVSLLFTCQNQHGVTVASGKATIMAPREKVTIEAPTLPAISIG